MKRLTILLLVSTVILAASCENERNIEWLKSRMEGSLLNDLENYESTFQYLEEYVYITSTKWDNSYGYMVMTEKAYRRIHNESDHPDGSLAFFDQSFFIIDSEVKSKDQLHKIMNLIIDFRGRSGRRYVPQIFTILEDRIKLQYYEINHVTTHLDTVVYL